MYARSGVSFDGLDHIINEFSHDILDEFVFDGELTLRNKDTLSDNEAFRIATGLVNSDSVDKTAICYKMCIRDRCEWSAHRPSKPRVPVRVRYATPMPQ